MPASPTAFALGLFIAWTLLLLIVMELARIKLVATGTVRATAFRPDNGNLSPFMQRLARAHANCVESLPPFGGLMLLALAIERTAVTDPLAYALVGARVVQSLAHLASAGVVAVNIRFLAFTTQLGIAAFWAWRLLTG